jgi:hypothetical protein
VGSRADLKSGEETISCSCLELNHESSDVQPDPVMCLMYIVVFDVFAKLWKWTISFVMSVRLHATTYFDENWDLRISRKSVEKIQMLLKSDKNNGYFTWRRFIVNNYFPKIVPFMRQWEKYGIAKQATNDVIWGMCFACRITKARIYTHTHVIFKTYCFSKATIDTRTGHNVMLYVHYLSCLIWLLTIFSLLFSYAHGFYCVLMFLVVYL